MMLKIVLSQASRGEIGGFVVYFKYFHIDGNILPMDKPSVEKKLH